ncbi:hypothetical protein HMPREF1885_00149 [Streptococcus agalactiae]|nr:hypothetical protein HMPREF1885_00149 [Streptococcus agalactiae]
MFFLKNKFNKKRTILDKIVPLCPKTILKLIIFTFCLEIHTRPSILDA